MGHHGHGHHHHHHGHHHHGHNTVVVTRVVPSPVVASPVVAHPPQTYYVAPQQHVPYPQTGYPPQQNPPYATTYPPQQHVQNYPPPTANYNNAPYPSQPNPQNTYPGQQHTTYPPPQNNQYPSQSAPFNQSNTFPPPAPFSAHTAPVQTEKRGWLTKEGEWVRSWKRRWFVLKNNTIYYYETETATESKGSIVLTPGKSVVYDAHRPGFKFLFDVKPTPEGRIYTIQADSEEEKKSWMHAIQQAIAIPEPMPQFSQHQYPAPSAPPQFM